MTNNIYQPCPLLKTPMSTMFNQHHNNPRLPGVNQFVRMIENHEFSFLAPDLKAFVQAQAKEVEFNRIGWDGGDSYMKVLMDFTQSALFRFHNKHVDALKASQEEDLKKASSTGDDEFDQFMSRLRKHDWFYSFSDDHKVYIKGDNEQKALEAIVESKKGVYENVFNHWNNRNKP